MNNARILLDCRCRDHRTGDRTDAHIVLGGDCKTERVGADADLLLGPERRLHPDLLGRRVHAHQDVRAGGDRLPGRSTRVAASSPTGCASRSRGRSSASTSTSSSAKASASRMRPPSSRRCWPTTCSSASIGCESDRYAAEIEYPVKTINANERDWVYQTDTGPILFPDLDCEPRRAAPGLELAFTAANDPTGREFIVRARTPIADGVEVYHYSKVDPAGRHRQRVLPDPAPDASRSRVRSRVELPARNAGHRRVAHEDHRHRVPASSATTSPRPGARASCPRASTRPGTSTRSTRSRPTKASSATRCRTPTSATARRWSTSSTTCMRRRSSARTRSQSEALWHKLRRLNRHAYNLSDVGRRRHRRRDLGHPRQGRRDADRDDARPRPREDPGLRHRPQRRTRRPRRSSRRRRSARRRATTPSRSSSGTGSIATSRGSGRRARRSATTTRSCRTRPGCTRYAQAIAAGKVLGDLGYAVVRGADPGPEPVPAQAAHRRSSTCRSSPARRHGSTSWPRACAWARSTSPAATST